MKIEISFTCPECEGYGKTESTTGGWKAAGPWMEYQTRQCHHCEGAGHESVVVDNYDTLEDAQLDYPDDTLNWLPGDDL
jgi:RecJ-like exonuclease